MPVTTQNGAVVPLPSDTYNLTADLLRLAKSLNIPIIVSSAAERDNLPDKYDGMSVVRTDEGSITQTYSGGAWYGVRVAAAAITIPAVAAGGSYGVDITYPVGVFPGIPRPTVTPPSGRLTSSITNMTATGFRAVFDNHTGFSSGSGLGAWHAVYGIA